MALRVSLFVLAALLLGAHFLRAGNTALVALCVGVPFLFLYRHRWSLIALQAAAYAAAAMWVDVALQLVQMKQQAGRAWTVTALILGAVALLTVVAGLLLNSRAMRQRYARAPDEAAGTARSPTVTPAAAEGPDRPAS